jgi:23S rRNA pseudouridine1911/1915/1917 synthase
VNENEPRAPEPTRLDKLVAEKFGLSRRAAQEAIRNGRIDLGGLRCDEPGREVEPDAAVTFDPNRPKARRVMKSGLVVLHEDPHLVVVDKPPGLLTLPTAAHEPDSLIRRVERYLAVRYGGKPRAWVAHRLDKDTSGAIVFARTDEALRGLQALLKAHDVERQYLAVVEGTPRNESGTINVPLEDRGTIRRGVARAPGKGLEAVTHYRVVERFGPVASLVACWLETGRTHQIRLHMAEIGHPVVGDRVYRPPGLKRSKAQFRRQALHAQSLGFRHPITGREVRVEAPLPRDLAALTTDLRNRFGIEGAGG